MDVIYSGRFYFRGEFQELEIGIGNGRIEKIGKSLSGAQKKKIWKAVIPSGFDTHVHFRDPGESESEDFSTGSQSALFGGTTTILDMPNNLIPIKDYERYRNKLSLAQGKSHCDFGIFSLFDGQNLDIIDQDSCGLKIFLGGSTNSIPISGSGNALKLLSGYRKPVVFHGEDAGCLLRHAMPEVKNLKDHDRLRPEECEVASSETISSSPCPNPVMTHISTPKSLEKLSSRVFKEVTPHHIMLNNDMELGSYGKCNPPLRSRETQEKLLQYFLDGKIDCLSSDHAPHTEEKKGEFQFASSGIIGVETRVPIMLALVSSKILPLDLFLKTCSENPARKYGIKKGLIEEGYFADFMSYDPSGMKRINQERLHSKNPITPFNNFNAIFPENVYLRGVEVIEGGELIDDPAGMSTSDLM